MLFGASGVRNLIILQYLDRFDFKKVLWRLNVSRPLMTCKILARIMVFNATFNNISVIAWQLVLLVDKSKYTKKPQTCCKSLANFIT